MKQHLFYTFLGIFVATAVVTLLGITQIITIDDKYLTPLFTALLIELVGTVIAMYRGVNFFDETKASSTVIAEPSKTTELRRITTTTSSNMPNNKTHNQALDLEEYFAKLGNLSERYREKTNFKKETNGKLVLFTGVVNSVGDSSSGHKITTKSESGKTVFIDLPTSKEGDVYSLRNGDVIKVCGIVDTELESSTSISTEAFERIQDESSNKPIQPTANASAD